jgi:hypothetical protein
MGDEWGDCIRAIALQTPWRKPRRYALCAHPVGLKRRLRGRAGHHIPGHEDSADQVQRDHEERREWHEVDQEDQELPGAHQPERDDPEPEIDLEGEIGQPQCGVADDDGGQRNQPVDDGPSHDLVGNALGQESLSLSGPLNRLSGSFCRFVFIVIDTVFEIEARTRRRLQIPVETSLEDSLMALR